MKNKRKNYDWTNNRSYYNKLRKHYLEVDGDIHCSYCKYHRGENRKHDWYGGFKKDEIKYPSWKIVSKNKKQWIKKNNYHIIEEVETRWTGNKYSIFNIIWKK